MTGVRMFSTPFQAPRAVTGQRVAFGASRPLRVPHRHALRTIPRASVADVARYLADAAAQIFNPAESDVKWEGTSSGFTGEIRHHDVPRLRQLASVVRQARSEIEGCTNPDAINYNPQAGQDDGSCIVAEDGPPAPEGGQELQGFISKTIANVFSGNFKGDDTEPSSYSGTGYSYRGRSQRDIRRRVDRLQKFERVIEQAIERAEEKKES
uniref:Uncharacterized protein n=1 Tax=Auxenochlorella protothecoides TaxID=3075 RepID=A0A1D2ADP7_AUXPR